MVWKDLSTVSTPGRLFRPLPGVAVDPDVLERRRVTTAIEVELGGQVALRLQVDDVHDAVWRSWREVGDLAVGRRLDHGVADMAGARGGATGDEGGEGEGCDRGDLGHLFSTSLTPVPGSSVSRLHAQETPQICSTYMYYVFVESLVLCYKKQCGNIAGNTPFVNNPSGVGTCCSIYSGS